MFVLTTFCHTSCDLMRSFSVLMFTPALPSAVARPSTLRLVFFAMSSTTWVTSSSLDSALDDLADVICADRNAKLAALLDLQPLIDELIGGLLFQLGGGLFLRGDGEEALALFDVVIRYGVIIDEDNDGDLLCHSKARGDDHKDDEHERSEQAFATRHSSAGAVFFTCDQVKSITVRRHELARLWNDFGVGRSEHVANGRRSLVCAEIFQIEVHEETLIWLDSLVFDEGALIGHGQQEAVILVLQAESVGDSLIRLDVVANVPKQRT